MNAATTSRHSKAALVLLIVLAGLGVWMVQQARLNRLRSALAQTHSQQLRLGERTDALMAELGSAHAELLAAKASRTRADADVAALEQQLAKIDPEIRWALPPTTLPDWNAESPYVWLRKDMLPRLPVSVFTDTGEINSEVALVLTADAKQQQRLNATLARLLSDYRALETAQAHRTEDHLPGIAGQDGLKTTVQVDPMPEQGAQVRKQFESALRDELGRQRADLLLQTGEAWLESEFSSSGTEPKTISVIRHPNGSYNISIKSGGSWLSTGGPAQVVTNQIPARFLPLFSDVLEPVAEQAQQ